MVYKSLLTCTILFLSSNAMAMLGHDLLNDMEKLTLSPKMSGICFHDTLKASSPSILIVDDSEINRKCIKRLLEKMGLIDFAEAENGKKALEIMRKTPLKLVIMDIEMPEMRGDVATQSYREEFPSSSLPIVAHSTLQLSKKELGDFGFNTSICKPCKKEQLQSIVNEFTSPSP